MGQCCVNIDVFPGVFSEVLLSPLVVRIDIQVLNGVVYTHSYKPADIFLARVWLG